MKPIITKIDKWAGRLTVACSFLAGIMLLSMVLIVFFEIVMRRVFDAPTMWSIELVSILMLWFAFLTLAVCQKEKRHVHVDLLVGRMGPDLAKKWRLVPLLFTLVFTLLVVYFSGIEFFESYAIGETSPTIWAPVVWPMLLAVPLGGIVLCIQVLADILTTIQGIDQGHKENRVDNGIHSSHRFPILFFIFALLTAASLVLLNFFPLVGLMLLLLVLLFAGVPIFVTLGLAGITGLFFHFGGSIAVTQMPGIIHATLGNFTLAALPPFILIGFLLQRSGAGEELYELFNKWIGWLPGGLGVSTILSCAFFAAISISSVATVATVGLIAIPSLISRKYKPSFSYGLVGAGATLGIMIPPSGTMILYAMITDESLGKLLIAGILPGMLLVALFIAYTLFYAWRSGAYIKAETPTWSERWRALYNAIWVILVPVIIILGIFSGVFTVLECGAAGALYTFVMLLARKKLTFRQIPAVLSECGINAGFIMIIIAGALIMGRYITLLQVPQSAMAAITAMEMSPGLVVFAIIVLLTILGLFLEVASVMMITLPVIYPVIVGLGYNGIWFAVIMTVAMEMAIITPPVGMNLFVIQGFTSARLQTIVKGVFPFFLIMLLSLFIFYFFPQICLMLPELMRF